jgi:hypothetical protein
LRLQGLSFALAKASKPRRSKLVDSNATSNHCALPGSFYDGRADGYIVSGNGMSGLSTNEKIPTGLISGTTLNYWK